MPSNLEEMRNKVAARVKAAKEEEAARKAAAAAEAAKANTPAQANGDQRREREQRERLVWPNEPVEASTVSKIVDRFGNVLNEVTGILAELRQMPTEDPALRAEINAAISAKLAEFSNGLPEDAVRVVAEFEVAVVSAKFDPRETKRAHGRLMGALLSQPTLESELAAIYTRGKRAFGELERSAASSKDVPWDEVGEELYKLAERPTVFKTALLRIIDRAEAEQLEIGQVKFQAHKREAHGGFDPKCADCKTLGAAAPDVWETKRPIGRNSQESVWLVFNELDRKRDVRASFSGALQKGLRTWRSQAHNKRKALALFCQEHGIAKNAGLDLYDVARGEAAGKAVLVWINSHGEGALGPFRTPRSADKGGGEYRNSGFYGIRQLTSEELSTRVYGGNPVPKGLAGIERLLPAPDASGMHYVLKPMNGVYVFPVLEDGEDLAKSGFKLENKKCSSREQDATLRRLLLHSVGQIRGEHRRPSSQPRSGEAEARFGSELAGQADREVEQAGPKASGSTDPDPAGK